MSKQDDIIDIARLRELVCAYGADPARWPETERPAAEALLQSSPEARSVQSEAAGLDALLDGLPSEAPSAALRRKVAEIPLRHPAGVQSTERWSVWRLLPRRAVWAGVLACTLGVASGALSASDVATSSNDDGWDDVTAVAFAAGFDEEP